MTKKILIIFTFILVWIGVTKVNALTTNEKIESEEKTLMSLIDIYEGNTWKHLNIKQYNKDNLIIFRLGDNTESQIDGVIVGNDITELRKLRILKNGYKAKAPLELGVFNNDDAYTATKIALDIVSRDEYKEDIKENLANYYKARTDLDETSNQRSKQIINAVYRLLEIADNSEENYSTGISILKEGDLYQDTVKEGYYSQNFKVDVQGSGSLTKYEIITNSESNINYLITDLNGEEKDNFDNSDRIFKIMIPIKYINETYDINVGFRVYYNTDTIYSGFNKDSKYVIYTPLEHFGEACAEIKNVKQEEEKHIGSLIISTNVQESTYKIYNLNSEIIGTYVSENGKIFIDEINSGEYILKQISVSEGYKLSKDIKFKINTNETTTLSIKNDKQEVIKEEKIVEIIKVVSDKDTDTQNPKEENKEEIKKDENNKEEINKNQNNNKGADITVLPRTGNDYFTFKILLIDISIFGIFLILILRKNNNKIK